MTKRATDVEKVVYRFVLSVILGFAVGCQILPSIQPIAYHVLPRSWCPPPTGNTTEEVARRGIDQNADNRKLGFLYIGMMSMQNKLNTRAAAAFDSWARRKQPLVDIEVFSSNNGSFDGEQRLVTSWIKDRARIIQLPGVKDVDYPPQKKSFSMIKFMHDAYIGNYDWFVRLDDDAYVDTDKLRKFLSRVNASIPWFIGSAGFGKNSDDWIRKGENYCMGGPGVIMSRALLRKLAPNLGACLRTLYTEHEDIELGRCVQRMTGVRCTMSWETKKLFYQNYQQGSYARSIDKLEAAKIERGLTFHANKDPESQLKFHSMVLKHKIAKLMDRVTSLENEVRSTFQNEANDPDANAHAQYRWQAIVGRSIFRTDEKNVVRYMNDGMKSQLIEGTNQAIRTIQAQDTSTKKLKEVGIVQSYHVVNPNFGADTVSHLLCTSRVKLPGHAVAQEGKEERAVHTRQYFSSHVVFLEESVPLSDSDGVRRFLEEPLWMPSRSRDKVPVNFIMALSGRPDNFVRFLHNFESTFLARGENVNLYLAYFPQKAETAQSDDFIQDADTIRLRENYNAAEARPIRSSDERFILENVSALKRAYPKAVLDVVFMPPGTDFSRGMGLQTAAETVKSDDEILFFCDVDLVFAPEMLVHIRRNTIQGKQAYYPVFFSQYDPDVVYVEIPKPQSPFHFEEMDGFWRHFSYGMVSVYKGDFKSTKGFDLTIQGWGLEDIHMVNSILGAGLHVFKSTEPAEVHIYHDKFCDPVLSGKQYKDCLNSRATHFGPKTFLYYLYNSPLSPETPPGNGTVNVERKI